MWKLSESGDDSICAHWEIVDFIIAFTQASTSLFTMLEDKNVRAT